MTFREYVGTLERELGVEIQVEDDACAFSYGAKKNFKIDILIHGSNEHGKLLTCADIGEPPPVGRERLFKTLLEANDFLGDTAGSTISLNPGNGLTTWTRSRRPVPPRRSRRSPTPPPRGRCS